MTAATRSRSLKADRSAQLEACGAAHLELPVAQVAGEPARVIDDYWKPISKEQLARRNAGQPLTHRLVRLAHVSRRSERLLGPLQGLLLDG
jgi:hypothetical protein